MFNFPFVRLFCLHCFVITDDVFIIIYTFLCVFKNLIYVYFKMFLLEEKKLLAFAVFVYNSLENVYEIIMAELG